MTLSYLPKETLVTAYEHNGKQYRTLTICTIDELARVLQIPRQHLLRITEPGSKYFDPNFPQFRASAGRGATVRFVQEICVDYWERKKKEDRVLTHSYSPILGRNV